MERAGASTEHAGGLPFDGGKLDALMEAAGLDALILTSKHNIQYLLGGYRFFFFDAMDALGLSRYLPVLVYARGRAPDAAYIGNPMESYERELGRFWVPTVIAKSWGTLDAAELAAEQITKLGLADKRIGVEMAFLPADAFLRLREKLPNATFAEAIVPLERLRAVKTPAELELLRLASEKVVDSMQTVIAGHGPGATKRQLAEALKREEVARGLTFEYCLITAGKSHNRAPSDQVWGEGDVLTLDSGGNYRGYIGDVCRMAIQGEPDAELVDLLGEVDAIQMAARGPVKAGARGGDVFTPALALLERSKHKGYTHFTAHGMGMIAHEAPRLTGKGFVPYPGYDEDRPLEAGMVLSIETTMLHPSRGYIKLEDTVAVTDIGWIGFGDTARGWNRGGTGV
ncbi:M24 family metallopeptidase [Labrys wisconsinensis]|uniref:Xaa-Pro aminopeptidase n=1 Tax=Labrys wisconsinensis TaxID=425677 RepID=A0ABU0J5V0_9HYPH|nr:Xaa-Pro peptidase family protein [Labrys wisconsinensis]MDQ0469609.1 Xaa-Pro aminopeptidase [Labrys wisconsinensis]